MRLDQIVERLECHANNLDLILKEIKPPEDFKKSSVVLSMSSSLFGGLTLIFK